jgi:3D (Asp-Asp-Asp) domain-containing protein
VIEALLMTALALAPVQQDGGCATYTVTAYAAEDLPGQMRNGQLTGPNVGTAIAVGVNATGAPLIPIGTTIWVEGYGQRVIMDTGLGGAGWLDILMRTHRETIQHGRQRLQVCW